MRCCHTNLVRNLPFASLLPTPQVPQMKSLDAVKVATVHRPANAPRGQVPPRATNRAGSGRLRYASSVEEAKAAAEAAAKATAARKALAASEATGEPGTPPINTTSSAEPPAAPAVDVQAPPAGTPPASESAPTAVSASRLPAPSAVVGDSDVGPVVADSLPRGQEAVTAEPLIPAVEKEPDAPTAAIIPGNNAGVDLTVDPFVRSPKLPRTPTSTPATTAPVRKTTTTLTAEVPAPSPCPGAGDDRGTDDVLPPERQQEQAVTPLPSERDGKEGDGGESPRAVMADPFASRSNIPRTPTDQAVPPQLSLFGESVRGGGGGGGGGDAEAMDLEGARMQIRELNQELACKRDSLAKQAEERQR